MFTATVHCRRMRTKSRLLGFAFASADLLVELDDNGAVAFVLGAGPAVGTDPSKAWLNRPLADVLGRASRKLVSDSLAGLSQGARTPPVEILVHCGDTKARRAIFSAFQLPQLAPAISCALSWKGHVFDLDRPHAPPTDAEGLISRVRERLSNPPEGGLALAFVDVPGLAAAGRTNDQVIRHVETALQAGSLDGSSAAQLDPERFAVLRDSSDTTDLADKVAEAALIEGVSLAAASTQVALTPETPAHLTLKALRYALEGCIRDGALERPELAFSDSLSRVMGEADRFRAMVRNREFDVHYQPIVDLDTGVAHHFEALARLKGQTSPAGSIRMAEELGLIESFDHAVLAKVINQMRQPGFGLTRIAANISGDSLATDATADLILRSTADDVMLRKRLIIEITESAAVEDIDAANRRIASLRKAGIKVCIDDFGIGAASLEYIRRLKVDVVKIDGSFVKDITTNERSRSLVSHLVKLCGDLDMQTVVEMIETEEQADIVRQIGVDWGQGWLYGRPTPQPVYQPAAPAVSRRVGQVVGWG